MIDLDRLRRALVLGMLGAVSMALLLPPLALLRYTDAHDWYAARKVSVAQALIAVGFDENASTKYRLSNSPRSGVAPNRAALSQTVAVADCPAVSMVSISKVMSISFRFHVRGRSPM